MKPIEEFLQAKSDDESACEDGIFTGNVFAAVVDGATSKGALEYDGRAPGRLARDLVLEELARLDASFDPDSSGASVVLQALNESLASWYRRAGVYEEVRVAPELRASVSVAVYCEPMHEVWMVGDCLVRTEYAVYGNEKRIDMLFSEMRAYLIEDMIASGCSEAELLEHDRAREQLIPFLKKQNAFQNQRYASDFSYSVIDGFFDERSPRRIIPIGNEVRELILSSDGYPSLERTLRESEMSLQRLLKEDPLMYRLHRSTKGLSSGNLSFDDRAYLRLSI